MLELPFIFVAGLLGSSHCLGMCGPFAITIGAASPNWRTNLQRQLLYSLGRVFTYAVLGATAGFSGLRIARAFPSLPNWAGLLAVLAGGFLIYQGLRSSGLLPRQGVGGASGCMAGGLFRSLFRSRSWYHVFLAGMFTGMLPCGLVYGFLALAASTGRLEYGAPLMAVFGLGTAPAMIAAGCGGSLLSTRYRARLYQGASWCVIFVGLAAVARGFGFISLPGWLSGAGCPMCP